VVSGVQTPERCCRRCEYWLPVSGLGYVETAEFAECMNKDSPHQIPRWDAVCPQFNKDANSYEPAPRIRRR
jgi:hypothetical protein